MFAQVSGLTVPLSGVYRLPCKRGEAVRIRRARGDRDAGHERPMAGAP